MFKGYVVLVHDKNAENGSDVYGVVTKDNGCPVFLKDEAEYEARLDPLLPNLEYRIIDIAEMFK